MDLLQEMETASFAFEQRMAVNFFQQLRMLVFVKQRSLCSHSVCRHIADVRVCESRIAEILVSASSIRLLSGARERDWLQLESALRRCQEEYQTRAQAAIRVHL